MIHRNTMFFVSFIAVMLAGCAATMPFQSDSDMNPSAGKAFFLMTVNLRNLYKLPAQLEPLFLTVCKRGAESISSCTSFRIDERARSAVGPPTGGNTYFLRMELEPGEYEILKIDGHDFLMGTFMVPLHADLKSNGSGVFYLGHIVATMHEHKAGEFRAGPPEMGWGITGLVIAIATDFGFYSATFTVDIFDRSDPDIADFKNRFPALGNLDIQSAILPAFDNAKAQRRWKSDPYGRLRDSP